MYMQIYTYVLIYRKLRVAITYFVHNPLAVNNVCGFTYTFQHYTYIPYLSVLVQIPTYVVSSLCVERKKLFLVMVGRNLHRGRKGKGCDLVERNVLSTSTTQEGISHKWCGQNWTVSLSGLFKKECSVCVFTYSIFVHVRLCIYV